MGTETTAKPVGESHIHLLGHTPLKQFLDFMTTEPVDASHSDTKQLADEWRAANAYMKDLQLTEATWADRPQTWPIPDDLQGLVREVEADPVFRRAFAF